MPLSSKFLTESTGEKNCDKWSIFSEDRSYRQSTIAYFFGPPCIWNEWNVMTTPTKTTIQVDRQRDKRQTASVSTMRLCKTLLATRYGGATARRREADRVLHVGGLVKYCPQ